MMRNVVVIACVIALAACSVTLDDQHFFYPIKAAPLNTAAWKLPAGVTASEVTFPASDGTPLHAVRVTREDAKAEVLYFGGNAFVTDTGGEEIAINAATLPVNMLMVDYRGYGRSGGKPEIDLLETDSLTAVDYLRSQSKLPIIVHGLSLGSFVAAHAAVTRETAGLVLESTATNVKEWASYNAPAFVKVKVADRLSREDNMQRVGDYRGSLLLVVGDKDKVTPAAMSRKLLDAAGVSPWKRMVVAAGKTHGDAMTADVALAAYRELIAYVAH
jgi:fermentation-respiration switch protein FrsA (DUF1100 family)